jgi:hypothetical protein
LFFVFWFFWDRFFLYEQVDLELKILLLQPPKCWDSRHLPPYMAPFFPENVNAILPCSNQKSTQGHCQWKDSLTLILIYFSNWFLSILRSVYCASIQVPASLTCLFPWVHFLYSIS